MLKVFSCTFTAFLVRASVLPLVTPPRMMCIKFLLRIPLVILPKTMRSKPLLRTLSRTSKLQLVKRLVQTSLSQCSHNLNRQR